MKPLDPRALPRFWAAYLRLGRTQAERARRIGISTRTAAYMERDGRMPTISSLQRWPAGIRAIAEDLEANE